MSDLESDAKERIGTGGDGTCIVDERGESVIHQAQFTLEGRNLNELIRQMAAHLGVGRAFASCQTKRSASFANSRDGIGRPAKLSIGRGD